MTRLRICLSALVLLGALTFWPQHAESSMTFDAELAFTPRSGTVWNYLSYVTLIGTEIQRGSKDRIGGIIFTVYDEEIGSSGDGLVSATQRYHIYESVNLNYASAYEDPEGNPMGPPDYSAPIPDDDFPDSDFETPPEPMQGVGGGGGGGTGGGGGGDNMLMGEADFDVTPIMESSITFIISESGRLLSLSGIDTIGEIIDPSRSITLQQVFQTNHLIVLPDYQVHLNESWRAPMSWTIPLVGETMEIPMTFKLSDIRTTYRFRVAAIDFTGLLQFEVDVSDEGLLQREERDEPAEYRKESHIKGDVVVQGRAYVDLDRGITVGYCDAPILGRQYFLNGWRRGHEWPADPQQISDQNLPGALNPGFYARLDFERRDLYTPLGNVIDPRQEVNYLIQNLQWFTTTIVE